MSEPGPLAVFVPSLGGGGAERVVVNLLQGLVVRGVEVDLVAVHPHGPLRDEVPPEVRVVGLKGGRLIAAIPSLAAYLRRRRPRALLSHLDTANLVALWARRLARVPTRIVVTTHISLREHAGRGTIRDRLVRPLVRWFYPGADAIVAVSEGVAAELGEVLSPRAPAPRVIHNPIVSDGLRARARALRPADGSRAPLPPEAVALGVPDGARLILSVGRLAPQKNHALLLDAFARLAAGRPDAHLVVLGEGRERPVLEQRLKELELQGRAHLPGFVADPAPWYAAASVFALSSDWEGLPTVLIEALLYGCPIVSTRCPSGPEEILENGRYGRLVPMDDPVALADAIGATLAHPPAAEPLRRRAEEFGIDRAVGEYLAVLFPGEAG